MGRGVVLLSAEFGLWDGFDEIGSRLAVDLVNALARGSLRGGFRTGIDKVSAVVSFDDLAGQSRATLSPVLRKTGL